MSRFGRIARFCAVAFALVACKPDVVPDPGPVPGPDPSPDNTTFNCVFRDGFVIPDSDGVRVTYTDGRYDSILATGIDASSFTITVPGKVSDWPVGVSYPSSLEYHPNGGYFDLSLTSVQKAVAGGYDAQTYMAVGETSSTDVPLHSCVSYLSFNLTGNSEKVSRISSITFSATGDEVTSLCGDASVWFVNERARIECEFGGDDDDVSLSGPFESGKKYSFVVYPGSYAAVGYEIRYSDGSVETVDLEQAAIVAITGQPTILPDVKVGQDDPPVPPSGGWYELPETKEAGDLFYASHSFTQSGRKRRNYTVCFSGSHHCPMWVAAPRHDSYEGSSGRSGSYKIDPDIPSSYQYNSKSTGGGCNKGHMLGSAERTCCGEANHQVFYYSNIAPQLQDGFNTGAGGWNLLEDWVDEQVPPDTLYAVIGCYFDRYTDGYGSTVAPKTISFGGRSDVSFPTMFYYVLLRTRSGNTRKALKDCSTSELKCAAFVRSHSNGHKGQKVTRKDMISVAALAEITGFTYFKNVPQAPKTECNPSDWGL